MTIHEHYAGVSSGQGGDIALVRLPRPLTFNRYVQPVCIPSAPIADGTNCVVTGWGETQSTLDRVFSARQHICYSALYAIARPSVRPSVRLSVPLSVTRVDQSKTFEVRITQLSPQSDSSFLTPNGTLKFEDRERGRQIRQGYEKYAIFSK